VMSALEAIDRDPICRKRDARLNVRVNFMVKSTRLRPSQHEIFCWTIEGWM
jgi:hypothetical protein